MKIRLFVAIGVGFGLAAFGVRDARACGGCFHPPPSPTEVTPSVITDHRMVFKVSANETILWDQVRYTGSPSEFAWVLPVHAGATIELSRNELITSLDTTTQTTVKGPVRNCGGGGSAPAEDESSGGGCGSSADGDSFASAAPQAVDAGATEPAVSVVSEEVIGPYEAVTLHANFGQGVSDWLVQNNFAIPDSDKPIIDAYTKEGFDFIALKLRPGAGVQAMRPVRIVSPGSDLSLPLRMVAAGVGAHVGLTLWIIGEGRYQAQSFPNAVVDDTQLKWDGKQGRSNLTDLETAALATNDGRTWITEVSAPLYTSLASNYQQTCIFNVPKLVPCSQDQLPASTSADAGAGADAGADAGTSPPPPQSDPSCTKLVSGCDGFDDMDVITRGLDADNIWITRIRSDLPVGALTVDLALGAGDQTQLSGTHTTNVYTDPNDDPCPSQANNAAPSSSTAPPPDTSGCTCREATPKTRSGTYALIALTAFLSARIVRRRRRS